MSPLFPERLCIALYPERLSWLLISRWKRQVRDKGEQRFTADQASLLQALGRLLTDVPRRTRISIILSNRLVRYACVPNPDATRNVAERKMLARHVFLATHGAITEQWEITLSHGRIGKNALAAAVDRALLAELKSLVQGHGLKLVSLQPYLMAAFNAHSACLPRANGLFALAEPGRLCALAWQDGGWAGVQQTHLDENHPQVAGVLARLRATTGMFNQQVHLSAPELPDFHLDDLPVNPLPWPPGLAPGQGNPLAGAMLGIY